MNKAKHRSGGIPLGFFAYRSSNRGKQLAAKSAGAPHVLFVLSKQRAGFAGRDAESIKQKNE
ncbi:hypothetical protein AV540_20720 [Brevibacillus parabrevis]|nr:hypothetical protein AV540_20720 [Brevibacillus parabrevis]